MVSKTNIYIDIWKTTSLQHSPLTNSRMQMLVLYIFHNRKDQIIWIISIVPCRERTASNKKIDTDKHFFIHISHTWKFLRLFSFISKAMKLNKTISFSSQVERDCKQHFVINYLHILTFQKIKHLSLLYKSVWNFSSQLVSVLSHDFFLDGKAIKQYTYRLCMKHKSKNTK